MTSAAGAVPPRLMEHLSRDYPGAHVMNPGPEDRLAASSTSSHDTVVLGRHGLPDEKTLRRAAARRPFRLVVCGPDPYPTGELLAAATGARLSQPEMTIGEVDEVMRAEGYEPVRLNSPVDDRPLAQGGVHDVLLHARAAAGFADVDGWVTLEYHASTDHSVGPGDAVAENPDGHPAPEPFLSVLVRTQAGSERLSSVSDTLTSLMGQSRQDFEVLVLAHDVPAHRLEHLQVVLDDFRGWFGRRLRLVPVSGGGRSAPLVAGARAARGRYLVALDDDDVVLGHWVETFLEMSHATSRPVLLRSCAVAQRMEHVPSSVGFRSAGPWVKRWAGTFDVLSQLVDNQCPIHTVAFPRTELARWNLWWNDDLPVLEDWDLLMRAALTIGLVSVPTITAVYRLWPATHSSFAYLPEKDWETVRAKVLSGWDRHPLVLPPDSATRLRQTELFRLRHRPMGLRARGFLARKTHETRVLVARTPLGPPAKRVTQAIRWARERFYPEPGPLAATTASPGALSRVGSLDEGAECPPGPVR